ncbi:MAG: hypothetical protein K2Q18_03755, partial [Bdellovibrionales bacterium]|nr:hypothetical protein [Bdellovibrionales bacterium]
MNDVTTDSTPTSSNYSSVLTSKFGEKDYSYSFGNHVLFATPTTLVKVMTKFRDDLGFQMLL